MSRTVAARCLAVVLTLAAAGCGSSRTVRKSSTQVGQQLALSAPDLAGREFDVGADQGKVRVIDFWASWCAPCIEAMPHLDRMARDLSSRGLAVYAVSFDEDPEQVARFLQQTPVKFPVLWDKGGDRFASRFEVNRLPTTVVVDRGGTIRWVQDGWSAAKARETRRQVEALLEDRR